MHGFALAESLIFFTSNKAKAVIQPAQYPIFSYYQYLGVAWINMRIKPGVL